MPVQGQNNYFNSYHKSDKEILMGPIKNGTSISNDFIRQVMDIKNNIQNSLNGLNSMHTERNNRLVGILSTKIPPKYKCDINRQFNNFNDKSVAPRSSSGD